MRRLVVRLGVVVALGVLGAGYGYVSGLRNQNPYYPTPGQDPVFTRQEMSRAWHWRPSLLWLPSYLVCTITNGYGITETKSGFLFRDEAGRRRYMRASVVVGVLLGIVGTIASTLIGRLLRARQKKRVSIVLALLAPVTICLGAGMTDFDADIGDGYSVYQMNSFDVCIGKTESGVLILRPDDHPDTGPLDRYIMAPDHILARNWGSKPRNSFPGDTLREVDRSRRVFFTISKATDEVTGPLSEREFLARPEVTGLASLDWQRPKPNPGSTENFLPWFVALPLIAFSLVAECPWLTFPLLVVAAVLLWLLRRWLRRRQESRRARAVGG
ncbi:MAG: hypothetical protein HN904_05055 [Victivallales bacterium]|jgi:hypothetical protein|nr:hypothetical protein [Victivallales bacterium]